MEFHSVIKYTYTIYLCRMNQNRMQATSYELRVPELNQKTLLIAANVPNVVSNSENTESLYEV